MSLWSPLSAQQGYDSAQSIYDGLVEKEKVAETELKNIPEGHPSRKEKSDELLRLCNQKEQSQTTMETNMAKMDSLNQQLMEAGLLTPPELEGEDDSDSRSDASSTSSGLDMQVKEVEEAEGEEEATENEAPAPMSVEGAKELDLNVGTGELKAEVKAEAETSGVITEAEDHFLDTPATETGNEASETPTDTPVEESSAVHAEDRCD